MEQLVEKLGWKKMAVIIVVGCLGLTTFAIVSLRNADNVSVAGKSNLTPAPTNASPGIVKTQEGSITSVRYNSEIFSIAYPESFQVVSVIPNEGISEYIRFVSPSTKEISVVVFSRQNNTIEDLSKPYQSAKYESKEIARSDMPGYYYKGGNSVLRLHEKVALFQKGYSIIRLQLSYVGDKDPVIEAQYDAMLASLQ
jgi:hypothetical protein